MLTTGSHRKTTATSLPHSGLHVRVQVQNASRNPGLLDSDYPPPSPQHYELMHARFHMDYSQCSDAVEKPTYMLIVDHPRKHLERQCPHNVMPTSPDFHILCENPIHADGEQCCDLIHLVCSLPSCPRHQCQPLHVHAGVDKGSKTPP